MEQTPRLIIPAIQFRSIVSFVVQVIKQKHIQDVPACLIKTHPQLAKVQNSTRPRFPPIKL